MKRGLLVGLVLMIVALLSCGAAPAPRDQIDTTISVGSAQAHAIPSNSVGFNIEMAFSCQLLTLDAANQSYFEQLFKNLGAATLHFNGHSADLATWQSSGSYSCSSNNTIVTPSLVDALVGFTQRIGWKMVWGLPLISDNPSMDASEAAYVSSSAGGTLAAFNIGNEAESYVSKGYRPSGWGASNYLSEWQAVESAVLNAVPGAKFDAPDVGGTSSLYASFASGDAGDPALAALSHHFYIPQTPQTIDTMLAESTLSSFLSSVSSWQSATSLPFVLSEVNTYSNGGISGVTNTLAASMWLLDASLATAYQGVAGIDIQQSGSIPYDTIDPNAGTPSGLYYGLLLAHTMMRLGTFDALSLSTTHNLDAYAINVSDGSLRVIIVNKDASDALVQITTPQNYTSGSYYTLAGPSLDATSGITLDGRTVSSSGTWSANNTTPITVNGNQVAITAPAGTALALTVTP